MSNTVGGFSQFTGHYAAQQRFAARKANPTARPHFGGAAAARVVTAPVTSSKCCACLNPLNWGKFAINNLISWPLNGLINLTRNISKVSDYISESPIKYLQYK